MKVLCRCQVIYLLFVERYNKRMCIGNEPSRYRFKKGTCWVAWIKNSSATITLISATITLMFPWFRFCSVVKNSDGVFSNNDKNVSWCLLLLKGVAHLVTCSLNTKIYFY